MTKTIDVSVIIPTYNRLWSLPKAVNSCRGTRCLTEIIVVDDGSTDDTWEWLQQQSDMVALRQPNLGQAWAANRGTAAARGRYVRYLDSDDFLCPGMIDRQFEAAVESGADLVYSRVDDYFHPSGRIHEHHDPPLWDDFLAVQLGEGYGSHYLGMLFRRELVADTPRRQDYSIRDDRMLLLEIGLKHPKVALVPGCAGYWVRHGDQIHLPARGPSWIAANWQFREMYRRILDQLEQRRELTPRRARAAARSLWGLAHLLAYTHPREGAEVANWVYRLDPQFSPPEAGLLGRLYRRLGFRRTEQLLRVRRFLLKPFQPRMPSPTFR
ncbi:MAG TPA: glycosyltransferase family 2 protein [Pirellulales bacterium]|jgi:glycosyltransferase involved in cell wall biosynthesis|nr:glycosyltransferase family 2 protein [Pirellulales bacterium]